MNLNSFNSAIWVRRSKAVDGGKLFFAFAVKSRYAVTKTNLIHFNPLAIV